jgi:hypothetical protein
VHDPDDLRRYRHASATPPSPLERTPVGRPGSTDDKRRAQFATQVARAEFGRFYWNGRLAGQLQAAMKRKPRRKGKKPR